MSENPESSTSATNQSSAQHGPNQPSTSRNQVKNPASFNEVMEEERGFIQKARQARKQPGDANQLVGLALSGGGIRSATFNLGVLQGLAELKLLPLFDYLSTVSGGGYIGGWLTAWIKHEHNLDTVQESLTPNFSRSASKDAPRQIKFLRSFSNYLTPKVGLFSADTWTFIAAYLRNLLLNLTILISALTAVLLLPRLIAWIGEQLHLTKDIALVLLTSTFLFLAFAIGAIMRNLVYVMPGASDRKYPSFTRQGSVQKTIVIPTFLAAWFGSMWLCLWIAIAAAVSLLLSCRVDINRFSLHLLYRNRITRAYLGASNPNRRPHPFTGFDPKDDFLLAELAETTFPGPYHIINTALNLVGGEELAWQERKAASFVFAPKYSGYEPAKVERLDDVGNRDRKLKPHGYRPSGEYGGGISLGTAVAISGAAASPNMGYHSSAPLAFLMTVFNVRLGWWLGNPRHQDTWTYPGPLLGLFYLVLELFGHTNDRSRCVYLSDGGHFENLGIYELVRRRCRYIVASDGSQDGALTFEDLGNAVKKCRTDLGIEIEMNVEPIRRRGDRSLWHCAVGIVHYEQVDADATPGLLVYLKRLTKNAQPPRSTNLWLPNEQDAIRHGFYYCNSLIQLMESVYLDLNLEQDYDHPDNRGWMNLFNHWSWAGMFRLTWAISASTYGARFQRFCERRVNLTLGEIEVSELPAKPPSAAGSLGDLLQAAQKDLVLNVIGAELIEKFQKEHPVTALGIYLLQLVVKDPMNKDQSTRFTFGFALVGEKKNLVYLRVQDHVRKMGLARQAIKELIRAHGIQDAQPLAMPEDAPEVPTEADQKQLVRLFRSVKYES